MKKWIASLLAFVIAFLPVGNCVAATLHLPTNLKAIEANAFNNAKSLDVVDLPWGTETIGSKAFAHSSLSKIYIPSTVRQIAPDAFEGSQVTIVTPDCTCAKEFADANGFAWEDGSNHYKLDTLNAVQDMLQGGEIIDSPLEDVEVELISTEGITDPEQLAEVNALNQLLLSYRETVEQQQAGMATLTEEIERLSGEFAQFTFADSGNRVAIGIGGVTYSLSGDALKSLGTDYRVISCENAEDGNSVITEVVSGGKTYYLISTENSTVISTSKNVPSQARATSRGVADAMVAAIEDFLDIISTFSDGIEYAIDQFSADAARRVQKAEKAYKDMVAHAQKNVANNRKNTVTMENIRQAELQLNNARATLKAADTVNKIWTGINIFGGISAIRSDIQSIKKLDALANHGHPIAEIDMMVERLDVIERMYDNIHTAQRLYCCDAILNTLELVGTIASAVTLFSSVIPPLAATAAGVSAFLNVLAVTAAVYMTQQISSDYAEYASNVAFAEDNKLHSFVHGVITDAETHEPVASASVTNGSIAVISDENGYYKIPLFPDSQTLLFRAKGYEQDGFVATLKPWQELKQDIELKPDPDGAMVFGTVTNHTTGEVIEGVHVTCGELETYTDASGFFRFEKIEPGDHAITFYKAGYTRWDGTFTLLEDQKLELNIALEPCFIITNREELEAIANNISGNFTLGNSFSLGDEPWTPLPWFRGTLDGAGYEIDGLKIVQAPEGEEYIGLFGGMDGGHISNLTLSGVDIKLTAKRGFTAVGTISGSLNNGSTLTNCSVHGKMDVTATAANNNAYAGGLVGFSDGGSITDCRTDVDVTLVAQNNGFACGLIATLSNGRAKNCQSFGDITAIQAGNNANAHLMAYGTVNSSGVLSDGCNANGHVSARSTNGSACAYGVIYSNNSVNLAPVSTTTETGNSHARGNLGGDNCINGADVQAIATQSGYATAFGLEYVNGGKNTGNVTARSVSGNVMASGGDKIGSDVINSGNVLAYSQTGSANAHGLYGQGTDKALNCENSGTVEATSQTNALSVGVYGCARSKNTGYVSVTNSGGQLTVQGMSTCANSTNYGNVKCIYDGESVAKMSVQGLNNCTDCTNVGTIEGIVNASTTGCTVTGAAGGSGNVNNGSVRASSKTGAANARGVRSRNSQNYGSVYAYSSAPYAHNDETYASAMGVDADYANSFNGGEVTAYAENGGAFAYGTTRNRNGCSSTGLVSATSNLFITGTDEQGVDYGWVGKARAYYSTNVQASVAGNTVSAANGQAVHLYFFYAASNCRIHGGMKRGFVSYEQGNEPSDLDGCFLRVGFAYSNAE